MSQTTYSIPNLSIYVPQPHKGSSRFFSSLSSCHNHFVVSALRWSFPVCGAFWWRTSRRRRTNVEWKDVAGLAVGAFPFPSSFCFWHAFRVSRTLCDLYMDRREAEKDSSIHCTYLSVNHASRSSNVCLVDSYSAVSTEPCPPVVFVVVQPILRAMNQTRRDSLACPFGGFGA